MSKPAAPRRGFAFAVSVSLMIHLVGAFLLLGVGELWLVTPPATKVEWVWTAPATPAIPAAVPPVPAAAPSTITPAAPAAVSAPPVAPPANPVAAAAATPAAAPTAIPAAPPAAPPPTTSPATPPAATPPASLPSGSGYAIVPPRLRERPPAVLPPQLAQAAVAGEVLLQVEVMEDGRVGRTGVTRSSGVKALDDAARQYVAGWRFDPAWQPQGQKPVRVVTAIWIRYGMQKE